ncbi:MAG: hypothetical protein HZC41_22395 [Chloroflexi bacterium]|nr:hypothetical protein [Chloroflexota bacterium]
MDERPYGCSRRALLGMLVVVGAMFTCIGISFVGVDAMCYSSLSQRLPIYPGATVTLERHNFIRTFGMGETIVMLESDDPPDVVQAWYGKQTYEGQQRAKENRDPFYYIATARYSVTKAEDGTGSQIILSGGCVG